MVTLFYTKIHSEFFIFLGVALHYTIHHKNNKEYKLSFVPKRSSCNSYIKIYLMGEQGSIPASVSTAYDSKKNKMSCKNNNIYIGDLIANQKYTIIYSIDNDELCSMEVSIHGYNK